MLLSLLYLEENYTSDYYYSVETENKMNILPPPQNLQFCNKREAIETVGMRQSKHKEVSKENSLLRLGNTKRL